MQTIAIIGVILSAIGTGLTGVYVYFTLRIVNKTQDALVSGKWQSERAIEAVNRQIEASELQAQESLYNQYKPVIVPLTRPAGIDGGLEIMMENKGPGIALNTWGILTIISSGQFYRFSKTYFLRPDKAESVSLGENSNILDYMFPDRTFAGYSIYPSDKDKLQSAMRLMVSYSDIFENKYLVIFDFSGNFAWRQFEGVTKIEQRLDENYEMKWSLLSPEQLRAIVLGPTAKDPTAPGNTL
jgi:hypothetical protein